jgi:hypothetical protein
MGSRLSGCRSEFRSGWFDQLTTNGKKKRNLTAEGDEVAEVTKQREEEM